MESKKRFTLKALRINNNWSQDEAGKIYGVSVDTVKNYEAYKTYPDVPVIEKILHATGLKYDDIIFLPSDYGETVNNAKKET